MSKYDTLDHLIVQQIARGNRTLTQLVGTEAWAEAERVSDAHSWNAGAASFVDRRLQSMRKRRLIEYSKGAWRIVELSTGSKV